MRDDSAGLPQLPSTGPARQRVRVTAATLLCVGALTGCGGLSSGLSGTPLHASAAADPLDELPVASFVTAEEVDDLADCIAQRWQGLAALGSVAEVTLHPSFRGLMISARAPTDPESRSYVEVYRVRNGALSATRVDYFLRSFVTDPMEDLRLRGLRMCL